MLSSSLPVIFPMSIPVSCPTTLLGLFFRSGSPSPLSHCIFSRYYAVASALSPFAIILPLIYVALLKFGVTCFLCLLIPCHFSLNEIHPSSLLIQYFFLSSSADFLICFVGSCYVSASPICLCACLSLIKFQVCFEI